jgi:hypothetical protein
MTNEVHMPYDPLVTMKTCPLNVTGASALGLAGWVVAAELLARMRKLDLISAEDAKAIISGALIDLDEPGEQLNRPRPLDEPSNDSARATLRHYLESWRPPSQQRN